MGKLMQVKKLYSSTFHMCQFGMRSRDEWGEGLVHKATTVYTNSEGVAEMVCKQCSGDHRHAPPVQQAKAEQEYPVALCEAFLDGVQLQIHRAAECNFLGGLQMKSDMCDPLDLPTELLDEFDGLEHECLPQALGGHGANKEAEIRRARQAEINTFLEYRCTNTPPRPMQKGSSIRSPSTRLGWTQKRKMGGGADCARVNMQVEIFVKICLLLLLHWSQPSC